MTFIRKHSVGFLLGALCLLVLSEVCPIFSIGFWRLAVQSEFAIGGVGISPGERLYLRLRNSFSPECSFVALYHAGNRQAQAYALYGLNDIHSDHFQRLRDDFRAGTGTVTPRAGCSTLEVQMHDLSYVFEDKAYLLKKAEEGATQSPEGTPAKAPSASTEPERRRP